MSKKFVLLFAVVVVLLFAVVLPAFAATNTFTGTLSASDPSFNRNTGNCGGLSGVGTNVHYQVFSVNVSDSGDYAYYDVGIFDADPATLDTFVSFYPSGGFNAADATSGCVDSADDIGTISLAQGNYTMVVSTFDNGAVGDFEFTLTGPGTISIGNGACSNPLPAGSVVYSVPAGAPTFYAADLSTQTTFALPAGTWWISQFSGDFAQVWIACQANSVWIPANAVAR